PPPRADGWVLKIGFEQQRLKFRQSQAFGDFLFQDTRAPYPARVSGILVLPNQNFSCYNYTIRATEP
ncbi:hypothetical protein, partial [Anabaena sp. CA = ATCC 33047]|uniref:hypothetical protein n=1 Tax=Anabaena sp. (strain CA / ATCC 33047) TaxID=52271 RepID=UPI001E59418D